MLKRLPLTDWLETKTALHLILQIIGKVKLKLHPAKNHFWHVTSYLSATGLTTGPIPFNQGIFEICINFMEHTVNIRSNHGKQQVIPLKGLYVSEFYEQFFQALEMLGVDIKIIDKPFDPDRVGSSIAFSKDHQHQYNDLSHAREFWEMLCWIYPVFAQFNGYFIGKSTPIHLFWHSMDYVLTFFSGATGPDTSRMDKVSKQAYSHEVISFGFWPGDSSLPEPAFYSYTYPEPKRLGQSALAPEYASWTQVNGGAMALLKYHDLLEHKHPQTNLMAFLVSAYQAGANLSTNFPALHF